MKIEKSYCHSQQQSGRFCGIWRHSIPGVTEDLLMSCYRKIPRTPDYIEYRFAYNAYSRPPLVDISPVPARTPGMDRACALCRL